MKKDQELGFALEKMENRSENDTDEVVPKPVCRRDAVRILIFSLAEASRGQ